MMDRSRAHSIPQHTHHHHHPARRRFVLQSILGVVLVPGCPWHSLIPNLPHTPQGPELCAAVHSGRGGGVVRHPLRGLLPAVCAVGGGGAGAAGRVRGSAAGAALCLLVARACRPQQPHARLFGIKLRAAGTCRGVGARAGGALYWRQRGVMTSDEVRVCVLLLPLPPVYRLAAADPSPVAARCPLPLRRRRYGATARHRTSWTSSVPPPASSPTRLRYRCVGEEYSSTVQWVGWDR